MIVFNLVRSIFHFREGLLRRALLVNTALAIVLSSVITVVYLATAKQAFRHQLQVRAESLASFIAAEAAYPLIVGDREQLRRIAQSALRDEDVLTVEVSDSEQRLSLLSQRPGISAISDSSSIRARSKVAAPARDAMAEFGGAAGKPEALGSVEVRLSRGGEQALFRRTIGRATLAGTVALVLILLVQCIHFRQLLKPLEALADFTRQIGHGDFGRRAPVVRHDEIGQLAISFNEMFDRLSATTVSRDYVDNIVRSMGDALIVTDRDLVIKTSNGAASRLFGVAADALVGCPLGRRVERIDLFSALLEDRGDGIAHSFEANLAIPEGRYIPARVTASVLRDGDGEVHGLVCLAQDITERRKVQQALVDAKNAAEESSRTKSNFLANMSHELRTPLNAIINYSEILLEDAEADGRQQDVVDLNQIRSSGKHLLALINDVLDLSKIEAGRMQVCLDTLSVDDILGEVKATCAPMAQKNDTSLTVENVGCSTVYADPMKLKQILINLVGNACKFTQRGAVVVRVYPRCQSSEDSRICWEVSDTGAGIAAEDLGKLFKSFSQVDPSNTRKHGGTGLGLAISQRLAGLMGGCISVASTLGAGSAFTLELPAEAAAVEIAAAPYETVGRPILLVDEDPRTLAACLKAWNTTGYVTEFATTPGEAARKAKSLAPILVMVNRLSAALLDVDVFASYPVVHYSAGDCTDESVVSLSSDGLAERLKAMAEEASSPLGDVAALMHSLAAVRKAEESGVTV